MLKLPKFKIIILLIICFLAIPLVVEAKKEELTLTEAIDLALKYDLGSQLAKANLEESKINYQQQKANNLGLNSRYRSLKNKLNLATAEENYLQARNDLIISVVDNHLTIVEKELDIKAKEKQLEYERELLKSIGIRVERGEENHINLLEQQTDYNEATFDLEQVENDYYLSIRDLELKINRSLDQNMKFKNIKEVKILTLKEEQALQQAVENNRFLELREKYVKLADISLNKSKISQNSELNLRMNRINKKTAGLEYEKEKKDLENEVKKKYYLLQQAIGILDLREQQLQQVEENYQIVKKQKEAGFKTADQLLLATANLLEAEYNYQTAVSNYYLGQLQLQKAMGLEIEVVLDELL
ncbi:MAG: TolC family protein [Bacillota bacterium]